MRTLAQLESLGDWIVNRDLARYHEREEQDDAEEDDDDDAEVECPDDGQAASGVE